MRCFLYIALLVFFIRPLTAANYTFEGYVQKSVSWSRGADDRTTVFLKINSSDPMLSELRIIFAPQDGRIESITWMGKNGPDLTKSAKEIPALVSATKDRRFKIVFSGPRFSSNDQDKLVITSLQWLPEETHGASGR